MTASKIIEKIPLNWALLSNPVNWVMVWLMVAIGYAGLTLIIASANSPSNEDD